MNNLTTLVIGSLVVSYPLAGNPNSVDREKPNIVFILADDLGWADLPAYGNTFHETPNIDRLASEGIRFVNAYSSAPVCSPTRASLMSGQYPARVGIIDFIPGFGRPYDKVIVPRNKTQYLPVEIETIGEVLKSGGYATGFFGKWHLGTKEEHMPWEQGFDRSHIYAGGGYYNSLLNPPLDYKTDKRLCEVLTDLSIDFIKDNINTPFFLILSHFDVHVQLDADRDLINKYLDKGRKDNFTGNAVYAAMVEHLDNSVGRIVQKLDEFGLEQNTIVIFYSDNGGLINRHGDVPAIAERSLDIYKNNPMKYIVTSNAPLRSEKGSVYEGGIRVPLIVRWPGQIEPNQVSKALTTTVDFYPTFMELTGTSQTQDQVLDGKSIIPELFENKYDYERAIFWHYPVYHHDIPSGAVRKGDWKLIENQVTGRVKLYNLRIDISEAMDMATIYPEITAKLHNLLKNWQKEVKAEFPVPNPGFEKDRREQWGSHPSR
jgi:arylsulfatase A